MRAQFSIEFLLCFIAFVAFCSVFIAFWGGALKLTRAKTVNATELEAANDACVLASFFSHSAKRAAFDSELLANASFAGGVVSVGWQAVDCGVDLRGAGHLQVEGAKLEPV
jgi:hypothetical protein